MIEWFMGLTGQEALVICAFIIVFGLLFGGE